MWKKDNKIFRNPLIWNDQKIFNPSDEELTAAGYVWEEPEVTEPPVILSKLSIIRVLGENWSSYRERIEEAGLFDQWNAATYLDTSDPAFAPWWNALTEEERELLKTECRY